MTAPGADRPGDEQVGEDVCRACAGTGRADDAACPTCGGSGVVEEPVGDA